MADPKQVLMWVFVTSGALQVALSVPLIRGAVPPNSLYGFRVRRTLADAGVWYAANRYAAWRLLWAGAVLVAGAVGFYFVPAIDFVAYALSCGALSLVALAIALASSFRHLRSVGEPTP